MGSKLTDMDVDPTNQTSSSGSVLKRCSSAPMINEINSKMNTSPSPSPSNREYLPQYTMFSRARRFSASFSPHSTSGTGPRLTPRVSQLRQEEAVDVTNIREVAHEREIHSAMQMSQSWEDLTLVTDNLSCKSDSDIKDIKPPNKEVNSFNRMLPLNISLPLTSPSCSSPSPTRSGLSRPCFSPGIHTPWKTSMSPSPTRKSFTTRRSLSPIAMRPSSLGQVKRKFELDDDKTEQYLCPPAKKLNSFHPVERGGLLMAHNNTSSPLPGSLSSVGTPESLSSADSPSFFHPVDSPPTPRILATVDEPMNDANKTQTQPMTAEVQNSA